MNSGPSIRIAAITVKDRPQAKRLSPPPPRSSTTPNRIGPSVEPTKPIIACTAMVMPRSSGLAASTTPAVIVAELAVTRKP